MSVYVLSDVHGRADEFFKMLDLIEFTEEDILYVLGDVMEYEYEPLKIMDHIMNSKNIFLLKGNQEDIFINEIEKILELDYFVDESNSIQSYINTIDVIARRGREYTSKLLAYLKNTPFITSVNDFILVHGDLNISNLGENYSLEKIFSLQNEHECIYGRTFVNSDIALKNITVILGHTIVMTLDRACETILYKEGKILIDCGAAINKKLACLRLDDMKEFYIDINKENYI